MNKRLEEIRARATRPWGEPEYYVVDVRYLLALYDRVYEQLNGAGQHDKLPKSIAPL